jgi:hypothetical protein
MPLDESHPAEPGQYDVRYAVIHRPTTGCFFAAGAAFLVDRAGFLAFACLWCCGRGVAVGTAVGLGTETVGTDIG